MHLKKIGINNFRNIIEVNVEPCQQFNIIIGDNGSGKTSFLEALHLLSTGRSFRTNRIKRVINNDATEFSIFAEVNNHYDQPIPLGLIKDAKGRTRIRLSGESINRMAELAKLLPTLLLNGESHRLLNDGPKIRRRFIDWGMFHVEQSFLSVWRSYQHTLKQRNSLLQQQQSAALVKSWNAALISAAEALDTLRRQYLEYLSPILNQLLQNFPSIPNIQLIYQRGWSREKTLESVLDESLAKESVLGYTQYGPHRADLTICVDKVPAQELLSRGQQKLLVNALLLSQGKILQQLGNKECVYLIDDLFSDLDDAAMNWMSGILNELNAQVFVTAITEKQASIMLNSDSRRWRVVKGKFCDSSSFL